MWAHKDIRERLWNKLEQVVVSLETGVPDIVEVLFRFAPALPSAVRFALWAMLEGVVSVSCSEQARFFSYMPCGVKRENEPISLKKCICSFLENSAAAILCTGASPHLCNVVRKISRQIECMRLHDSHLVVKSTLVVQEIKELRVCLTSPEVKVGDFEVTPDCQVVEKLRRYRSAKSTKMTTKRKRTVASIVGLAAVVGNEAHRVVRRNVFRILLHELLDGLP